MSFITLNLVVSLVHPFPACPLHDSYRASRPPHSPINVCPVEEKNRKKYATEDYYPLHKKLAP